MTAPTDHHLTIIDRDGNRIHGDVVHMQAYTFTLTEVHIITILPLDCPYRYKCVYVVDDEPVDCYFAVFGQRATVDGRWLFKGLLARAEIPPGGE